MILRDEILFFCTDLYLLFLSLFFFLVNGIIYFILRLFLLNSSFSSIFVDFDWLKGVDGVLILLILGGLFLFLFFFLIINLLLHVLIFLFFISKYTNTGISSYFTYYFIKYLIKRKLQQMQIEFNNGKKPKWVFWMNDGMIWWLFISLLSLSFWDDLNWFNNLNWSNLHKIYNKL